MSPETLVRLASQGGHWRRMAPRHAAMAVAQAAGEMGRLHDQGRVHGIIDPVTLFFKAGAGLLMSPDLADLWCRHCTPPEWLQPPTRHLVASGDVYSLGAALYVLLAGQLPFEGLPDDLQARILRGELIPPGRIVPSIPAALEAICLKAMALEPVDRHASAAELAEALRNFLKPRRKAFWK